MQYNHYEALDELDVFVFGPSPLWAQVTTFSKSSAPNEPGQFCSLFVLGGAMKYSGLVLPWDQAGGGGFVSEPRPALPVCRPLLTPIPRGGGELGSLRRPVFPLLLPSLAENFSTPSLAARCSAAAFLLDGYFQQVRCGI